MRFLLVATVTLFVFAGCTEAPVENVAQEPDNVITDPTDYSYVETDGEGWHIHDYWKGQDELDILERSVGYHAACFSSCSGFDYGPMRPATDVVIPQGAQFVNVTFSWTERADEEQSYGDVELWIQTAADHEPQFMQVLDNGVTATFESTNAQNDPPHQRLSLWGFVFMVRPPGGEGEMNFAVDGTFVVTAAKGLEIPEWPPHPDHWQGSNEIILFEDEPGSTMFTEQYPNGYACYGSCMGTHSPGDGLIVPWDATSVEVVLAYEPGIPAFLELEYHGADSWSRVRAPDGEMGDTPLQRTYSIPLQNNGDSPYAKQSLWEFRVVIDGQPGDTQRYSGGYTLSAKAVK